MPRSKEEFKAITDERRNSILAAALKLFAIRGYDSVSVDHITHAAKCSHGLFYHYYRSKADLFQNLVKLIHERWLVLIQDINFQQEPVELLQDITDFYIDQLKAGDYEAYVLYLFLTFHLQKNLPHYEHDHVNPKKGPFKAFPDVVREGQEKGLFLDLDVEELARVYYATLEGLAYNRIYQGKRGFKNVDSSIIVNMFIKK